MTAPKRKPWICQENDCKTCWGKGDVVPEECPFSVLHALDLTELRLIERPRQWGKTYALAEITAKMLEAGCNLVVICPTLDRGQNFRKILARHTNLCCEIRTKNDFWDYASKQPDLLILTDDLSPKEVDDLRVVTSSRHDFVLGYYTEEPKDVAAS